jgi:exopolysaccharide biosynthesis polyprenyl glycosylphosphotransferase
VTSRTSLLVLLEVSVLIVLSCASALWWEGPTVWEWRVAWSIIGQMLVPVGCLASAFYYCDLYDFRMVRNVAEFCSHVPRTFCVALIFTVTVSTVIPQFGQGLHLFPFGVWGLAWAMILSFVLRWMMYTLAKTNVFAERVLVLGSGPLAWKIVDEMDAVSPVAGEIIGFVADNDTPFLIVTAAKRPVLGTLAQLDRIIAEVCPDRMIVALGERRGRLPIRVLLEARMRGIQVEDGIVVHERLTGKLAIESLSPSFLIFSKDFKKSRIQMALRRAVSLLVAGVGVVMSSFLMLLIAVAIKLDSVGPVFFMQERAGVGGRAFHLIKFRTMRPDSNELSVWEQDNRYRITRVGKWLRRFRLDELPQFFNVLRGDMNLVGPRPHPVSNYKFFLENIPYYSLRSAVRPGMTGWAQVCYAYANNLEEETEKMRYDLFYIKNLSLWLDLRIILDTIKTVLFGHPDIERTENMGESVSNEMIVGTKPASQGDLTEKIVTTAGKPDAGSPLEVLRRSA